MRRPRKSTLFPYTTLFRSRRAGLSDRRLYGLRDAGQVIALGGGARKVDRKSTRLNSSHLGISYAVFCLKKKKYAGEMLNARSARIEFVSCYLNTLMYGKVI